MTTAIDDQNRIAGTHRNEAIEMDYRKKLMHFLTTILRYSTETILSNFSYFEAKILLILRVLIGEINKSS